MREAGLAGASRRRGTGTTRVDPSHRAVPDQVERQFQADAPDRIWVADITYVPTWAGFVYLAIVLDVFSRRVVGWSMAHHLRTRTGARGAEHGVGTAPPPRGRTSLRPGLAVHLACLWEAVPGDGGGSVDRVGRRLL